MLKEYPKNYREAENSRSIIFVIKKSIMFVNKKINKSALNANKKLIQSDDVYINKILVSKKE